MYPTEKVLGRLAAIQTLIENFPMSILDMFQGKRYTSTFEFLIDVLNACGVNTNEIIEYLLDAIYGIEDKVEGGLQGLYDNVTAGTLTIDNQSPFIQTLEGGIKGVFMALFTTIFGCSAIPYLYDGYLDRDVFVGKMTEIDSLVYPIRALDILGMLGINPTTEEGQLYYFTGGKTKYYRKTLVPVEKIVTETRTATTTSTITVYESEPQQVYTKQLRVAIQILYECESMSEECVWKFYLLDKDGKKITNPKDAADEDITIYVNYNAYGGPISNTWEGVIPAGKTSTIEEFKICPKDSYKPAHASEINSISINNQGSGARSGKHTWVYLDKDTSYNACNDCYTNTGSTAIIETPYNYSSTLWNNIRHNRLIKWNSLWDNTNNWGTADTGTTEIVQIAKTKTITAGTTYNVDVTKIEEELRYEECTAEEVNEAKNEGKTICMVSRVPEGPLSDADCEYISYYDALKPNELYKSMDMNAFIWYVINKGMNEPQLEKNHLMWDSRVSAAKNGVGRKNAAEWNKWYASKSNTADTLTCEFLYEDSIQNETDTAETINFRIKSDDSLYPILQFDKLAWDKSQVVVRIPSQRYYKPKYRDYKVELERGGSTKYVDPNFTLNSSLYKFDWDYLKNIQILHPRIMVVRMCEYLLNLSLTAAGSLNFNTTRKLIEAKVMNATKKIIEADDMEVEDCYMVFSNDEYNDLIDEMLLSKYSATKYNGEVNKAMVHDTDKYAAMINDIDSTVTMSGTTTQIKRLVTEVTTTGSNEEPTLEYGIQVSTNENLLKRLIWAIAMPIVESILTPQIMLLLMINLQITGVVDFNNQPFLHDYGKIFNILLNKVLGLTKSIVILIKNEIVILLAKLFFYKVIPLLQKKKMLEYLEAIEYWLMILKAAVTCLPTYQFPRNKIISSIDYVDYADIDNTQNTPESTSLC